MQDLAELAHGDRRFRSLSRRQGEAEGRSLRIRLHPDPTALPLNGFLAECKSEAVPGVFSPVQALENLEDPDLECRGYARAVVFDRNYPIATCRLDEL
jgi:hypothetical protein